jgi:HD-like signal output (HDOD) protein
MKTKCQDLSDLQELRRKLSSRESLPSFPGTIQRLVTLESGDKLSARDLARIILEDYGLIGEVLKVVNSFYYNRVGKQVTTVTQAVILLGFDTIREIALGMAVLDLIEDRGDGPLVDLLAQAFLAANTASGLQRASGDHFWEEAFLTSLFHPLARIVVAIHDEDCYRALSEAERDPDRQRQLEISKFWAELGQDLSKSWNMPSGISRHLEGAKEVGSGAIARKQAMVRHANSFAQAAVIGLDSAVLWTELKNLEARSGLPSEVVLEQAKQALRRTSHLSSTFQSVFARVDLGPGAEEAGSEMPSGEAPVVPEARHEAAVEEELSSPASGCREMVFLDLLNQLSESLSSDCLSLDQFYLLAIEALFRGIGVEWVVLCLLTPDRRSLTVRYGVGEDVEGLQGRLVIPFPPQTAVLKQAFERASETVGTPEEILGSSSPGLVAENGRLCVSPLVIRDRAIGCFLLDRRNGKDAFVERHLQRIRAVRHLVVIATRQRARA